MFTGEKDLNNPKHRWNLNRLSENKLQYLEYQKRIGEALKQDVEKLLRAFEERNDLSFIAFSSEWRKLSFSLIFVDQVFVDDIEIFAEFCFFIIKKYLIFSSNTPIKVGAFYLLYGIYSKQPGRTKIRIRMTKDEYSALLKLVEYMENNKHEDFVYIFNSLRYEEAFLLVATTRQLGLELKFTWQEKKMKNDIFQDEVQPDYLKKLENVLFTGHAYNLANLEKINEVYATTLQQVEASTSKTLAVGEASNYVKQVEDLFTELKSTLQSIPEKTESVLERRTKVRNKAFKHKV